jgi:hypothetical protein
MMNASMCSFEDSIFTFDESERSEAVSTIGCPVKVLACLVQYLQKTEADLVAFIWQPIVDLVHFSL